ncbi:MAG: metalloregulator ArsR/SmtB family transcription factor [Betaproteobacteria bacterium]
MTRIKFDLVASMRGGAKDATAALRVLANEDRLLLLCELCGTGERSVGDLEAKLDIRQPTLSQQLSVLRREGMVRTRRSGRQVLYSVADVKVRALLRALHAVYCR